MRIFRKLRRKNNKKTKNKKMARIMLKICFLLACITVSAAYINLLEVCSIPQCNWKEEGLYSVERTETFQTETLIFDRLQNSVISLRNFPNIHTVVVQSQSPFDHLSPCGHIVDNVRSVRLIIGNEETLCKVVTQQSSTVESESAKTMNMVTKQPSTVYYESSKSIDTVTKQTSTVYSKSTSQIDMSPTDGFITESQKQMLISRLFSLSKSGRELSSTVSGSSNALSSSELTSPLSTSNNVQTSMAYDYNILISSSIATDTDKVQRQFPHYILIYVLILVLIFIYIVIIKYFSKEKSKMMRFISNVSLFHNLKPIYKSIPDSDASDYLVPNTSSVLMSFSQDNENSDTFSDTYETVLYDRSENNRISVSTNL